MSIPMATETFRGGLFVEKLRMAVDNMTRFSELSS